MSMALYRRLNDDEQGFTLIELLVVVIIIGILAAIAIPTFLNQRTRAWNSAAESELRNAAVVQESWYVDNGEYASAVADLESEGFNSSSDVTLTINSADTDGYCMQASHDNSSDDFMLDSDDGEVSDGTC